MAAPMRPMVIWASLSTSQRWSAFSFVKTQATTRDWR
jgi:hypothetical protein